jgi:16S rRNA U516 pseudouridylate synthase RsuA-like enzyme
VGELQKLNGWVVLNKPKGIISTSSDEFERENEESIN